MNVTRILLDTRKLLIAGAVTAIAATCVASGHPADATTHVHRPAVHQATKEWKSIPSSGNEVVAATKEWKVDPFKTKEW
ncbi:hypothetical protein BH10ACT10_BH10ACT10_01120 [soil metagenome]